MSDINLLGEGRKKNSLELIQRCRRNNTETNRLQALKFFVWALHDQRRVIATSRPDGESSPRNSSRLTR